MRRVLGAATLAALAALLAMPGGASAAKRPFIYVVVIDGLDGDAVEGGNAPFISSMIAGEDANATYFPGSRSVMPAVTNANHAAMMTGAYSGDSGVAGNAYALYAPLTGEESCDRTGPLDLSVAPTPTTGQDPGCLRAETAFESIARQRGRGGPATAAIFGKPKLGRLFAQERANGNRFAVDHLWAPCSDDLDTDEGYCGDVATNPASGYALEDSLVMDEVVRTITEGVPAGGRQRRPRLTFVNLPQVDSAGHAFGPGPGPYTAAIGVADDEIERLVDTLKAENIWSRSVLITLSDHSMDLGTPKVTTSGAFSDAGVADSAYSYADTEENGSVELVYLNDRTDPNRFATLKAMRAAALGLDGVSQALYRRPNPLDGGQANTVAAQFPGWRVNSGRTGDLFLTADPGRAFSDPGPLDNRLPGHHGAPHTTDNFLAVSGGGALVEQGTIAGDGRRRNPVNVDVAPTVMRLLGLRPPADNRGRILKAFDRAKLRRLAR